MNKKMGLKLIEYTSLLLVLSFFLFHNIYIELIGIVLALLSINKVFINILVNSQNKKGLIGNQTKADDLYKLEYKIRKSGHKNSDSSLVQKIEELGFIPSLDKDDDINVA